MKNEQIRLIGINAPEVRGIEREQGIIARDWLREKLPEGKSLVIQTAKDRKGKYGRWLATLFLDGVNINDLLVQNGMAVYADY
jgi:micrococcal nuclease